jgi:hypothetical protein
MKKKELYESIMTSVAKEVKKALNESESSKDEIIKKIAKKCFTKRGNYKSAHIGIHKIIHPIGIYKNELIGPRLFPVLDENNYIALDDFQVEISNKNGNWKAVYASHLDEEDLLNILSILDAENINANTIGNSEEFNDEEYDEEYEIITYNDIIDAVEGEDYQEIIDDDGYSIGEWILDRINCPENGEEVYDACVEIAQRLLDGESADDLREELGDVEI